MGAGMTSHTKMLDIMDLFTDEQFAWTIEDMAERLGYTRSTLYRYLRELVDAGFLTALPEIGYTPGPRIIELEALIQRKDPLIQASRPFMVELVGEFGGFSALCRSYGQQVMCVHHEYGTTPIVSGYAKGAVSPLLLGSASRTILAHWPAATLQKLYRVHKEAFAAAGLGEDLEGVKASLRSIRQKGWDVTFGQVTRGVAGIAAPILDGRQNILGSLSVVVQRQSLETGQIEAIADKLTFCARTITRTLGERAGDAPAPKVRPGRSLVRSKQVVAL